MTWNHLGMLADDPPCETFSVAYHSPFATTPLTALGSSLTAA